MHCVPQGQVSTGVWIHTLPAEGHSRHPLHQPASCSRFPLTAALKSRVFPHLIFRHDIERVLVQGESHVPEDGAAILHHSHCLVQRSSLQRTVHPDLQRQTQGQWMWRYRTQWLNGYCTFVQVTSVLYCPSCQRLCTHPLHAVCFCGKLGDLYKWPLLGLTLFLYCIVFLMLIYVMWPSMVSWDFAALDSYWFQYKAKQSKHFSTAQMLSCTGYWNIVPFHYQIRVN